MWTDEYWDIQRRAYWGVRRYFARRTTPLCSACASGKPDASKHSFLKFDQRLRTEEVFLNDILNLLMRLAPQSLYRLLIEHNFDISIDEDEFFESLGNDYMAHFGIGASTTQPDFFAVGQRHTFAIELKLGTKCDLRQVLLYLALAAIHEQKVSGEQRHFLLLLTPTRSFSKVFKEGFADQAEFKNAFAMAALNAADFVPKQARLFQQLDLLSLIPRFRVAHMTFAEFAFALDALRPRDLRSGADEVLEKLLGDAAIEMQLYDR